MDCDCGVKVISTVILNATRGRPPLLMRGGKQRTPKDYWPTSEPTAEMLANQEAGRSDYNFGESELNVVSGELMTGVLDKSAYGPFGLVHSIQVYSQFSSLSSTYRLTCGKISTSLNRFPCNFSWLDRIFPSHSPAFLPPFFQISHVLLRGSREEELSWKGLDRLIP